MPNRPHIPNSSACGHWETLLPDVLDGLLAGPEHAETLAEFEAHMAACPNCAELYHQASQGREWLSFLASDIPVPDDLLDRILAQTSGPESHLPAANLGPIAGQMAPSAPGVFLPQSGLWGRSASQSGFKGFFQRVSSQIREPRLMMTAAMAFFSIALTMNLAGIRLGGIKPGDLRPEALRSTLERRITMASTPIIRYYDRLRFVYEVESRMRELRQSRKQQDTPSGTPSDQESHRRDTHPKDGGSRLNAPSEPAESNEETLPGDMLQTRLELLPHTEALPCTTGSSEEARQQANDGKNRAERSNTWTA